MLKQQIAAAVIGIVLAAPSFAQDTPANPEECDEQTANNQQNDECVAVPTDDDEVTGFVPLALGPLLAGTAGVAAIGALSGGDSTSSTTN